ncbi:MAG: HAMP domain-containing histidine kinase [Clostridia bacterium]|nr:HAMP domain-containing histidine kinase [Clostridia bacterium]
METFESTLDAACLQVFGKISAAVSHDLKNVLAIVNENAGLLDDLALRASKGGEIPPDRLGTATARIIKQVKRGDTVLKNLNRFAHSTDVPVGQVNVAEMVQLVVDLAGRQVAMKELTVTVAPSEAVVTTCVVYLESLVYLLLRRIIETLPRRESVEIGLDSQGQMVEICLANPGGLALLPEAGFPDGQEQALMQWLGVEIKVEQGRVRLRLPRQVNG